jgi:hypothetical protein
MVWKTREAFLDDRENLLNGYQYNTKRVLAGLPAQGLLIFTHRRGGCGTSLAIQAEHFRDE